MKHKKTNKEAAETVEGDEALKPYLDKANESARKFIGAIGKAIIELPSIREPTQARADKIAHGILDDMLEKFCDATTQAFILHVHTFFKDIEKDDEEKEGDK